MKTLKIAACLLAAFGALAAQDAFTKITATGKLSAPAVHPLVEVKGNLLTLSIPIDEIAKSEPRSAKSASVGFLLGDVEFSVNGHAYRLAQHWVTLKAGN